MFQFGNLILVCAHLSRNQTKTTDMRNLKFVLLFALVTIAFTAKSQNLGMTINRGVTIFCPDYKNFVETLNHGYGFGFYKYKPIKNQYFTRTGINVSVFNSCQYAKSTEGEDFAIPKKFIYIDMPLSIEKHFYTYSKTMRHANHYSWSMGINLAYMMHEKELEQHVGSDYESNPLNVGFHGAFQILKPLKWKSSFAVGPEFKGFSTGEDRVKFAFQFGLRLDWKFGSYIGKK